MADKRKSSSTTAVTPAKGGKGKSGSASKSKSSLDGKTVSGGRSGARADNIKNNDAEISLAVQLAPYGMVILALVLTICLVAGDSAGVVGGGIRNLFTGLAGGAAYFIPVFIVVKTIMWNRDRVYGMVYGKMTGYASIFVLISILFHVFGGGSSELKFAEQFNNGQELIGGGIIGGMLGNLLVKGFGKVCTVLLVISAVCLLIMYIFGITPRGLWITLRYKLRVANERRLELLEEKRAYENDYIAQRNREKEEEYAAYLKAKRIEEREAKQRAKIERDVEKRAAKVNQQQAGSPVMTQPPQTNQPRSNAAVYKVSRRKIEKSGFRNEYADDIDEALGDDKPIIIHPDELEKVETGKASERDKPQVTDKLQTTGVSQADDKAVDDKIFDEVMRRTRERIEKNRVKNTVRESAPAMATDDCIEFDIPESLKKRSDKSEDEPIILPPPQNNDSASFDFENPETDISAEDADFYTPETVDALNKAEEYDYISNYIDSIERDDDIAFDKPDNTEEKFSSKPAYSEEISAENSNTAADESEADANSSDEDDISGLFVNPEDAELLDRLSQAYIKNPVSSAFGAGGTASESEALNIERTDVGGLETEVAKASAQAEVQKPAEYIFPPIDILTEDNENRGENIKEELQEKAVKLVDVLNSFHVKTKIEDISRGPAITRYELHLEPGTKVRSVTNLVDDIALNLATTGVRIEAPIPGKSAVGIEVPNKIQSTVHLRTLIETETFQNAKSRVTVCLGENVAGEAVYFDIAKMPHLLIAGATGMGKSVCINSLITSLLYKAKPDEVKLILIDPKKVELNIYNGIPHLIVPVVSDPKKAAGSLSWAVNEMERRFGLIEAVGVRDIKMFNEVTKNDPDYEFMPQIVIIIDELADLMMTAPDDVEESICRLAQKARAAGMHLIIGTQRPSVDVITGLIKANIPSRIAFTVSSQVDSRTIIDKAGAENLIGRGDMLFNPVGASKPIRVQGAFVSETDVEEVVSYIKNMNSQSSSYSEEVLCQIEEEAEKCGAGKKGSKDKDRDRDDSADGGDEDPMFRKAVELAIDEGKISTSLLQRRLGLGYGRAAKLIDRMEELRYVSEPKGQKGRDVYITRQQFMELTMHDE